MAIAMAQLQTATSSRADGDRACAGETDVVELRYRVILEPEDEGGFSVVIPAFPHGHTQGETVEEALANAREVIELEIAYALDKGLPLPASDRTDAPVEFVSVTVPAA